MVPKLAIEANLVFERDAELYGHLIDMDSE